METKQTLIPFNDLKDKIKKWSLAMVVLFALSGVGVAIATFSTDTEKALEKAYNSAANTFKVAQEAEASAMKVMQTAHDSMCATRQALAAYKITLPEYADQKDRLKSVVAQPCTF